MSGHKILCVACALAMCIGSSNEPFSQTDPLPVSPSPADTDDDWRKDMTVLAIAPDGTWGVATDASVNRAIVKAISECKSKYQKRIGCGYQITIVRAGWTLGIRCGNENIIVADRTLIEAEQAAIDREVELRQHYVPTMPPCIRVVSINPQGTIIAPNIVELTRMVMPLAASPR